MNFLFVSPAPEISSVIESSLEGVCKESVEADISCHWCERASDGLSALAMSDKDSQDSNSKNLNTKPDLIFW